MKVIAVDTIEARTLYQAFYQHTHLSLPCLLFDHDWHIVYFPNGSQLFFVGDENDTV